MAGVDFDPQQITHSYCVLVRLTPSATSDRPGNARHHKPPQWIVSRIKGNCGGTQLATKASHCRAGGNLMVAIRSADPIPTFLIASGMLVAAIRNQLKCRNRLAARLVCGQSCVGLEEPNGHRTEPRPQRASVSAARAGDRSRLEIANETINNRSRNVKPQQVGGRGGGTGGR